MPSNFIRQFRTERRRALRQNSTPAEWTLWWYLRNRKLDGYKFRRQHHVDRYILDFYCSELSLAVEVDGDSHFTEAGLAYDCIRSKFLQQQGIKVLRFTNQEVGGDLGRVLSKITAALKGPPHPSSPPREERE